MPSYSGSSSYIFKYTELYLHTNDFYIQWSSLKYEIPAGKDLRDSIGEKRKSVLRSLLSAVMDSAEFRG